MPNASDLDLFQPPAPAPPASASSCSYFGTMGEANDLTAAVEAARLLPDVHLRADGRRQAARRARARRAPAERGVPRRRPRARQEVAALAAALGRLPDPLQGRARAGHQLAQQAVRHVRRRAPGDREHGRLDARSWWRTTRPACTCAPATPATSRSKVAWLRDHPEEVERMGRNARAARRARVRPRPAGRARAGVLEEAAALTALSYCVVNTNGRELAARLPRRDRAHPSPGRVATRCWCSTTPPRTARPRRCASAIPAARLIALDRRDGQGRERLAPAAARRAARFCLLLNEDTELRDGRDARAARRARGRPARRRRRRAAAHQRGRADRLRVAAAERRLGARRRAVHARQLRGAEPRRRRCARVGWVQSSAMLVRREAAEQVGLARPGLLRLLRRDRLLPPPARRRLADPVRARRPRPSTTTSCPPTPTPCARRIVEFHRGRDLYFRKHRMPVTRRALARLLDLGLPGARGRPRPCCPATPAPLPAARAPAAAPRRTARACARPPRSTTAAAPTAGPAHLRCRAGGAR